MFRPLLRTRPAIRTALTRRLATQPRRHFDESDLQALKVPSIGARLKPLIPFFIWWSIITSLTVHHLQIKKKAAAELDRSHAQESVLSGLIDRFQNGEVVPDVEIRRELEMVGLRERTQITAHLEEELGELRDITWWEVILGRKRGEAKEKGEQEIVQEWTNIVNEASATTPPPPTPDPLPAQRAGVARRAQSSTVYM